MDNYIHKVKYYETDKMGITHHSNYIRWMEEARVEYMDQMGFGYAKLEKDGVISPVIGIECDYRKSTTFDDEVCISADVDSFNGVKLTIRYTMTLSGTGEVVLTGKSKHCFLNKDGHPISLRREYPEFAETLKSMMVPKE